MEKYIMSVNTVYIVKATNEEQAYEKAMETEPKTENIHFDIIENIKREEKA